MCLNFFINRVIKGGTSVYECFASNKIILNSIIISTYKA